MWTALYQGETPIAGQVYVQMQVISNSTVHMGQTPGCKAHGILFSMRQLTWHFQAVHCITQCTAWCQLLPLA
jgi:hypothetical protein